MSENPTNAELIDLQCKLEEYLKPIENILPSHWLITLVARDPNNKESEIFLSMDDPNDVIESIHRAKNRQPVYDNR